jgi:hypothetical protein
MLKKILLAVLCSLMGAIFIFSGYTKLYPIEPFEYTFVDLGLSWQMAPFVARILIAFEFLLGFFLLLNLTLNKLIYKLAILLLGVFCIYLFLLIFISGNKGNCGCFGSMIEMTPLQALVKNIVMLAVFFILYGFYNGWETGKLKFYLIPLILAPSLAAPFILNPVELNYSQAYLTKPKEKIFLPLDSLYNHATLSVPPKSLSKGKHILMFLSLSCKHCRIAAKKARIIYERDSEIPIYFILNGKEDKLKGFFEDTGSENIPHCILLGRNFVYLAGVELPVIYLINNSIIENQINYLDLDQGEIEKWLAEK